jgi:hypothetical protein
MSCRNLLMLTMALLALSPMRASAQQIGIGTPFHGTQDDFFERFGIGFGFNLGGQVFFRQGGFASAIPPFGGYDPNGDATMGFALNNGPNSFFFNLAASQGSTRSMVSQTPVVVIPNGGTGTVSDTSTTPFVTGIIPVVGFMGDAFVPPAVPSRFPTPTVLQEKLQRYHEEQQRGNAKQRAAAAAIAMGSESLSREDKLSLKLGASRGSSAGHGDLSVAEIKSQQAAEEAEEAARQQEVHALIERAKGAEDAGKANVAKIYYRQALSRASGELRDELQARLSGLEK